MCMGVGVGVYGGWETMMYLRECCLFDGLQESRPVHLKSSMLCRSTSTNQCVECRDGVNTTVSSHW